MTAREVKLTNFQLKQIFEYLSQKVNEPGETPKYSWFIYKTCEALAEPYAKLMNELYDERREPEYPEFDKEQKALVQKYADRDEQNTIITDDKNRPLIRENSVEFTEENAKLLEKYPTLNENWKNKEKTNYAIFQQLQTYNLTCLELSEFPPKTPPSIVGVFGY